MSSMPRQPTSSKANRRPRCPVCFTKATHWGQHEAHGVIVANYLCANEHGWLTKWVAL